MVTGTGHVADPPPKHFTVAVAGNLNAIAASLQRLWKRPVMIPVGAEGKVIRERTLTGSPEEMAEALGLELAPEKRHPDEDEDLR